MPTRRPKTSPNPASPEAARAAALRLLTIRARGAADLSRTLERRGFDRVRPDGPYKHGIAPVAEAVDKLGLVFGLWFLPFGRNFQDPEYKDRQDWFVKRENGKPYDTVWGGTCLDLTHPEVRDVVAGRFDQIMAAFDKASLHQSATPPEAAAALRT